MAEVCCIHVTIPLEPSAKPRKGLIKPTSKLTLSPVLHSAGEEGNGEFRKVDSQDVCGRGCCLSSAGLWLFYGMDVRFATSIALLPQRHLLLLLLLCFINMLDAVYHTSMLKSNFSNHDEARRLVGDMLLLE